MAGRAVRSPVAFAIALALAPATAQADSNQPAAPFANRQLPDPKQERAARALMEEVRCLVCQGQSIADSDAELAGDMRSLVRERIAAGERPEAIRAWLIERYGDWVSYAPQPSSDTAILFAAPLLLLLVGGFLAARRFRPWRRP
jgi:cytochrome c-type biogenesis protein CcmH